MVGRRVRVAALCVLVAWGLVACAPTAPFGAPMASAHKTLTQNGGLRMNVQLVCAAGQDCTIFSDMMARSVTALEARAQHGLGVNDASAKALSAGQIEVDLPGDSNQQAAVSALTTQGLVQFIDTSGAPLAVGTKVAANRYPVLFTGSQVAPNSVSATTDQQAEPIVVFEFAGAARAQFAQYTNTHEGAYLTITLDHTVIESAQIQSEIDGEAEITGAKSMADAQALAAALKSSPLPLPVTLVSIQPVAASGA